MATMAATLAATQAVRALPGALGAIIGGTALVLAGLAASNAMLSIDRTAPAFKLLRRLVLAEVRAIAVAVAVMVVVVVVVVPRAAVPPSLSTCSERRL